MRTLMLALMMAVPIRLGAQVTPTQPAAPEPPAHDQHAVRHGAQTEPGPLDLQVDAFATQLKALDLQMQTWDARIEPLKAQLDLADLQMAPLAMAWDAQAAAWDAQQSALDAQMGSLQSSVPQQPSTADSLYRAARDAMSHSQYNRAAELFSRIAKQHARSAYAPDAYYWLAFNLYRAGGDENLDRALETLERQQSVFPDAQTLRSGDAQTLATRIRGLLARQGDVSAAAKIAQQAQQAEAGCDTTDQDMRIAALNALLQMNADQAVPILKKVIQRRDPCSVELRRKAMFLLSQKQTPETVDIMLDVAKHDPDLEVRRQAVFWLSQVDDPRAVDALAQILKTSTDVALQKRALFALSQHSSPRAYAILKQTAENPQVSQDLRKYAITWIAQHKNADVAYLEHLYGTLKDPSLKERVLFAVAQSDQAGAADWLLGVATDTTAPMDLRKRAIFWAGQAHASIAAMSRLYDHVQARELKEQLLFVYSQSDDSAAVDRLIQVAKTEKDPELRKRAIFWLGQSSDPRAAKALMDIIGG